MVSPFMTQPNLPKFRSNLLAWYHQNARALPWRQTDDPYPIWLAEVMLQQTTVTAVIPYYQRFLQRFPTLQSLAEAPLDDVLHHWQGLGYYRRAHLLHRCAQTVVNQYGGLFPQTEPELLALPGFGPYTAAAVAAQAFHQPAAAVDGNVERVITRLYAVEAPLPGAKATVRQHAAKLADPAHPRDYTNAIIELGATVCTPTSPKCQSCPVAAWCQAHADGTPTLYPVKAPKKAIPTRHATMYVITDAAGNLCLRRRPAEGLLGGLWEVPHSGWEGPFEPPFPVSTPTPAGPTAATVSASATTTIHSIWGSPGCG